MFKCMCEGCFLNILLNFVSELLSVFSDGHDDLRHRIQHQILHHDLWTKTKENKAKHFTMIPQCRHHRGFTNEVNSHIGVRPRLCSELAAWASVHGHWSSGQVPL